MFPDWWYEWLWDARFKDADYNLEAFQGLMLSYFWLVLIVIAAIFLATLLGRIFRRQVFRIVDAVGGFINFAVVLSLVTVFLVLYHGYHPTGPSALDEIVQISEQTTNLLDGLNSHFPIPTPIDFDYIDRERVDALYNQLEPELVEKERTTSGDEGSQAELGIGGGGISAEAQREKSTKSTSSFSRTHFSQERECVEVMKYVVDKHSAKAYTTGERWMWFQQVASDIVDSEEKQMAASLARQRSELGLSQLPPTRNSVKPLTDEQKKQKAQEALMTELQSLQGLVFVDDAFDKIISATETTLVAKFATKPRAVVFRVHVPRSARADLPKNGRLRVFGDVVRPLGNDGYVEVRAIAVF